MVKMCKAVVKGRANRRMLYKVIMEEKMELKVEEWDDKRKKRSRQECDGGLS